MLFGALSNAAYRVSLRGPGPELGGGGEGFAVQTPSPCPAGLSPSSCPAQGYTRQVMYGAFDKTELEPDIQNNDPGAQ